MFEGENRNSYIPLKSILRQVIRRWYLFALFTIGFIILAFFQIKRTQPAFKVESSLILEDKSMGSLYKNDLMKEMNYFSEIAGIEEQIGVLTSYTILEKAVKKLNSPIQYFKEEPHKRQLNEKFFPFKIEFDKEKPLILDSEIQIVPLGESKFILKFEIDKGILYNSQDQSIERTISDISEEINSEFGAEIETDFFSGKIKSKQDFEITEDEAYSFSIRSVRSLVKEYKEDLIVESADEESNIVKLEHTSVLIENSKNFLNTLMDVYIQDAIQKKSRKGEKTIAFIDDQISGASDSLKRVENIMESFQERSKVIDVEASAKLMVDQRVKLEELLSERKLIANSYEYIYANLNAKDDNIEIHAPGVLEKQDPLLSGMLMKLADLQQEKAKNELTAVENSPIMDLVTAQINSQRKSIFEHIKNARENANAAVNDIRVRISRLDNQIYTLPGKQKELAKIERKVEFNDEQYRYLLQKRAEASIALAGNESSTYVLDNARLSSEKPVSPNKGLLLFLALVLGISLPASGLVLFNLLNSKITALGDIELNTEIPVIGIIVKSDMWSKVISPNTQSTRLAESFRSARVQLQYLLSKNKIDDCKIIGVTSSRPNEGKSFCAANLASTLAISGKKTLLIDLDLRKPDQKEYFVYDNSIGLHGYLVGKHRYTDIITKIENIDGLYVFPSGPIAQNSLDILDSQKFQRLMKNLRKRFDHVIIDTPPIGHTSDYFLIKDMVDFTVYVVRHNLTSSQAFGRINKIYEESDTNNVGILINGVKEVEGYNYGEGASYGYGNSKYGYNYQFGMNNNKPLLQLPKFSKS